MDIPVGATITLKKKHPCGGNQWRVLRIGADFKIQCETCDRIVWLPRATLEKRIKQIDANM